MRLPRYRLRTLLIAVAVVALGMGTIVGLARRRESFRRQAAQHRKLSNDARLYAMSIDRRYLHWGPSEPERAEMALRGDSLWRFAGRVDLGGRPPRPPTDPDVPVEEASGSSSHDFATRLARPWTTRARGRL